ncbi:MAG: hypothetical protein AAB036_05150 [Elusimicrobiota bacterium]
MKNVSALGFALVAASALVCSVQVCAQDVVPAGLWEDFKSRLPDFRIKKAPALKSFQVADAKTLNTLEAHARKYGHREEHAEGVITYRLHSEYFRTRDPKDTRYSLIFIERLLPELRLNPEQPIDGLVKRSALEGFLAIHDLWGPKDLRGRIVERAIISVSYDGALVEFRKVLMKAPDGSEKSLERVKDHPVGPIDERTVAALWEDVSKSVLRLGTDL